MTKTSYLCDSLKTDPFLEMGRCGVQYKIVLRSYVPGGNIFVLYSSRLVEKLLVLSPFGRTSIPLISLFLDVRDHGEKPVVELIVLLSPRTCS